jgi:hypothetical protein
MNQDASPAYLRVPRPKDISFFVDGTIVGNFVAIHTDMGEEQVPAESLT